jgi:hypothetical protein
MAALVLLGVACSKLLGIDPANERVADDGGTRAIIDATAPPGDGSLPPLGDKDAACGDTTSDPKNCGACGLDCRGGSCSSGRCEPFVFVYGLLRPSYLAVTDDGVYWTDSLSSGYGAGVRTCELGGCPSQGPRTLFERTDTTYRAIAVGGDHVVALRSSNTGGIDVCGRLGCGGSPLRVPSSAGATSMTMTGQHLHWTTPVSSASAAPDAGVWRCEFLPYCVSLMNVRPKGNAVRSVGSDLYVIDNGAYFGSDGVLMRCIGSDCTSPKTLASGLADAWPHFAASKEGIGWLADNNGVTALFVCEPQSCAGGPKTLATLGGYVENFAFDAKYLYWTNNEYSTVERVAWTSTNAQPEVVLTKQGLPGGIAMRDGALYFTRFDFGDIVRWVPPP